MKSILVGISAACVFAMPAAAQKIHPQCTTMKDKVGCTCAMENGGSVNRETASNNKWTYPRRSIDAFAQCMKRAGRS